MAFCTKCGTEVGEGVKFCTGCGSLIVFNNVDAKRAEPADTFLQNTGHNAAPFGQPPLPLQQQINIIVPPGQVQKAQKVKGQTVRLIIGIATVVLFFLMQVQSCTTMGVEFFQNLLDDGQRGSGGLGYTMSFFFLIAGIVSIACRKSKAGTIVAGCIYALFGLVTVEADFSLWADLEFFCLLSFAFAVILVISGILQKTPKQF